MIYFKTLGRCCAWQRVSRQVKARYLLWLQLTKANRGTFQQPIDARFKLRLCNRTRALRVLRMWGFSWRTGIEGVVDSQGTMECSCVSRAEDMTYLYSYRPEARSPPRLKTRVVRPGELATGGRALPERTEDCRVCMAHHRSVISSSWCGGWVKIAS